jgi:hypothetical protein
MRLFHPDDSVGIVLRNAGVHVSDYSYTTSTPCGLKVSDNRALARIAGPKETEVAGGWRKLRNGELHTVNPR